MHKVGTDEGMIKTGRYIIQGKEKGIKKVCNILFENKY